MDVAVELPQRLLAVLGGGNQHARLFEREAYDIADMRVIVDDQNGMSHVCQPLSLFERYDGMYGLLLKYRSRRHARKPHARQFPGRIRSALIS